MVRGNQMRIKDMRTYIEDSYPIAYSKARKELGSNLIIVEQKDIKQGGFLGLFAKKKVKITFGIEQSDPTPKKSARNQINQSDQEEILRYLDKMGYNPNKAQQNEVSNSETYEKSIDTGVYNPYKNLNNAKKESTAQKKENEKDIDINEMRETLKKDLKAEFQKEFFTKGIPTSVEDPNQDFWNKLRINEIREDIINDIKDYFKKNNVENSNYFDGLKKYFWEKIKVTGELNEKFVMLVGPTGVGKTTSGAKLAGTFWREKNDNVAFITSDVYRVGASDQLREYANIMKVPTEVVYSPEELKTAIEKFRTKDFVVLDTAGLNPGDKIKMDDLKNYVQEKNEGVEIALVLASNCKLDVLINTIEKFKSIGFKNIIFSKLDETTSIGALLTIMYYYDYPLSYITAGQSVPDDIELATKELLWEKFIEGLK